MTNDDLRKVAVEAIANYMHHELFEITKSTEMLPWLRNSASELMDGCDRAIAATKAHPMAEAFR